MCEIFTIITSVIFTTLFFVQKKNGKNSKALFSTMLISWGAAIMWFVDCVASVIEGESFFDISSEDAILGILIVGMILVIFGVLKIIEVQKSKKNVKTA